MSANQALHTIQTKKSSRGCKWIIILAVIFAILSICCIVFGLLAIRPLFAQLFQEIDYIREEKIIALCEAKDSLTINNYKKWFNQDFLATHDFVETKETLDMAFPEGLACESLKTDGIIDSLLKGQSFHIQYEHGSDTADFTYPYKVITDSGKVQTSYVTFYFEKSGDEWLIEQIKLNQTI